MTTFDHSRGRPRSLSPVGIILRGEGLALFVFSFALFLRLDVKVWLFPVFLLLPDIGMLGYLVGSREGSLVYNAFHTLIAPILLGGIALLAQNQLGVAAALIWSAHIGMDHVLGFGLKKPDDFRHTHLQDV